jgi:hypothetical protein
MTTRYTTVHAVPAESSTGHRMDRRCACGPIAMRDLATGRVDILRHRTPPDVRAIRNGPIAERGTQP